MKRDTRDTIGKVFSVALLSATCGLVGYGLYRERLESDKFFADPAIQRMASTSWEYLSRMDGSEVILEGRVSEVERFPGIKCIGAKTTFMLSDLSSSQSVRVTVPGLVEPGACAALRGTLHDDGGQYSVRCGSSFDVHSMD